MQNKPTTIVIIPVAIQYLNGSVSLKYVPIFVEIIPLHMDINTARYPTQAIKTPRIAHQLC